ncbi:MAG: 2-hydroxyacid dehydrogenase [Candidatus Melainabacteria bacterium]|nr:2-hydroxyacid dehydrogenase [Candidatus Melainabacteria bacterium]
MKVAVFSAHSYDETFLQEANAPYGFELTFFKSHLAPETARLADGADAVCVFVNDDLGAETLHLLAQGGVRVVALRCAGFNNVDLATAERLGIRVVRVPAYSPHAVAEHAVALIMTLNRQTHRAYNRVREGNFRLAGLLGFDVYGLTVGVVGTGKIGQCFARIMHGFGCQVLASDPYPNEALNAYARYVPLETLWQQSDVISLHCPLTPQTHHLVNETAINQMKPGVMLINTSRGGLIDTAAVIEGLKHGQIGYLGLDVYEEEEHLFFEDLSGQVIHDDLFSRLLTFPHVLITGHQAFFTRTALENIAQTTLNNLSCVLADRPCPNQVLPPPGSVGCVIS